MAHLGSWGVPKQRQNLVSVNKTGYENPSASQYYDGDGVSEDDCDDINNERDGEDYESRDEESDDFDDIDSDLDEYDDDDGSAHIS
jgi:hypothetical protein